MNREEEQLKVIDEIEKRGGTRPRPPAEAYRRWQMNPSVENYTAALTSLDYAITFAPNREERRRRLKLRARFIAEAKRRRH